MLGAGNQLEFNPTPFSAAASGGGIDSTGSQLQLQVSGNTPTDFIDQLILTEVGNSEITGAGTASTHAKAGMSGFATVLAANGLPIAPVIIPFVGVFVPGSVLVLVSNPGTTNWTGVAVVDIATIVPNATLAVASWDDDLFAISEAGSSALIAGCGPSAID